MDLDVVSFQFSGQCLPYKMVYGIIQLPSEKLVAERLVHVYVNGPVPGTYVNLLDPDGPDVDITPVFLELVPQQSAHLGAVGLC